MKKLALTAMIASSTMVAQIVCVSPIQSFSDTKKMSTGDFSANVLFQDINLTEHAIGYGPGKNKHYEVSILDGKIYMARPGQDGTTIVRHVPKADDGAAMLQVADVSKWGEYKVLDEIESNDALNFELDDMVEESGCASNLVLPFKIIGRAASVTWSMDTDNHRVDTKKEQNIVIEGIYTTKEKSKYFMVKGTNTHMHVILTDEDLAGHLQKIVLKEGAKLYLPVK